MHEAAWRLHGAHACVLCSSNADGSHTLKSASQSPQTVFCVQSQRAMPCRWMRSLACHSAATPRPSAW